MADNADIFGNPTGGLDVSDEALADRWEEDTSISDGGVDDEVEVEGDEGVDAEAEGGEEVVEETPEQTADAEADGENVENGEGDFAIPSELQGKSPEELARMVVEGQKLVGRHATEVGEVRNQIAEMQSAFDQRLQEYAVAMMQMQAAPAVDLDDLSYGQALDMLDQGIVGVDAVNNIIEAAYEAGDVRQAREMERDFMYRMARAEAMQATNARIEQVEQKYAPVEKDLAVRAVQAATNDLYREQPEDATAYGEDVVRVVKQPTNQVEKGIAKQFESDPKGGLEAALNYARGLDPTRSKAYRDALEAQKASAQVEGGASGEAAEQALSPADRVRASVFDTGHEQKLSLLGL